MLHYERDRRQSTDRKHVQNRCDLLIQRICRARFNPSSLKTYGITNDFGLARLYVWPSGFFFPLLVELKLLKIRAPTDPDAN